MIKIETNHRKKKPSVYYSEFQAKSIENKSIHNRFWVHKDKTIKFEFWIFNEESEIIENFERIVDKKDFNKYVSSLVALKKIVNGR